MRVAVVFDTPYSGWDHPDHERQMQRAHTRRERGHEVRLLGECDDFIQRILDAAVTRYERS
jgi:hypothetical protein